MKSVQNLSLTQRSVTYCVGFAAFLFQFEAFFVHLALPDMQRELGVSAPAIAQVITCYLLGSVLALLPGGALGRQYGFARVFTLACLIATIATLLCGFAGSLTTLWVLRFVQGVGIGLMVSTGYTLIPMWLESDHLGWGFGVISQGAGLGMVLGVPAGGLVAHLLEWRWVFLVQVPVFVVLVVFAIRTLPVDIPRGEDHPSLKNTLGRLLGNEVFIYCIAVLFLFQFVLGGARYLAPFYLESVQQLSSIQSSLYMLLYALGVVASASVAGRASDRYGSGSLLQAAYSLAGIACLSFAAFLYTQSSSSMLLLLPFLGVASGLFSSPNNRLVMRAIPADLVQNVGAILPVALNLGVLAGISLFQYEFHEIVQRTVLVVGAVPLLQDQRWGYAMMYGFSGLCFLALFLVHVLMAHRFKARHKSA